MIRSLKIKKSLLFILGLSVCLVPDNYSQSQNFNWEALEHQIQEEVNNHLQNLQEKTLEEQRAILETMDPKHIELMTRYVHPETVGGTLIEEIYNMNNLNPDEENLPYNHVPDSDNHNSLQPYSDDDTQFDIDNHHHFIQLNRPLKDMPIDLVGGHFPTNPRSLEKIQQPTITDYIGSGPPPPSSAHPPNPVKPDLKENQMFYHLHKKPFTNVIRGSTHPLGSSSIQEGDSHFDIDEDLEKPSRMIRVRKVIIWGAVPPHPEDRDFDNSFFPVE